MHTCSPVTVNGSDCLGRESYGGANNPNPFSGFAGGMNDWQFSVNELNSTYEVFADMFVGWTYNTWAPGPVGANRDAYMNAIMAGYLR